MASFSVKNDGLKSYFPLGRSSSGRRRLRSDRKTSTSVPASYTRLELLHELDRHCLEAWMDAPRSMSIVPPSGSQPLRTKSLRQQRASNGANMIKAYVQQSEQRREQSKFHSGPRRVGTAATIMTPRGGSNGNGGLGDDRDENAWSPRASTAGAFSPRPTKMMHSNQETLDDAHALDALFADRRVHRSRRPSVYVAARRPSLIGTAQNASLDGEPASQLPHEQSIKPIERRRLQMETVSASAVDNGAPAASPHNHHAHSIRPATTAFVPHHPRTRHNLAAKLDALTKSSAWGRRKVVLTQDDKGMKGTPKGGMSRHANPASPSSHSNGADNHHTHSTSGHSSKELSESEIEMRVMAAFRQIVRLWRERKRKAEAAAMSKMNRNSNGIATGTGRNGSKLRKDLTAQSSNVVGIISRRLIREIPALKFFDDEPDAIAASVSGAKQRKASTLATAVIPSAMAMTTPAVAVERATPRGVCYTLDAFGCRKIKMQSSTTIATATPQRNSKSNQKPVTDEIVTLEKAMSRSLRRKMARRIKSRRSAIVKLSDEFSKSRRDLAMKLRSQLALQHAEIEKTFSTRLTLLMSDDGSLPPYKAQKELHLARLRCKKANVLQKCETLRVLGLILKHVEAVGAATGLEASTGELHFLDLFRCVVEENQVLTPIISDAIRQRMRPQDLTQPVVMELFRILDMEMHCS